jgi:hypothetical protein
MKALNFFSWLKSIFKKTEKQSRPIDNDDPYATIKHKTREIGMRSYRTHNNRKRTRGRNIQYVTVGRVTKPIYHCAN